MKKYKSALIGCGRISLSHINAFTKNIHDYDLLAVCDLIPERCNTVILEYCKLDPNKIIKKFTNYKEMLTEIKPEIVTIATESGRHSEIAIDCLNAGAHVICEKPMALSSKDADSMILTAKITKKKLAIAFQNRFNTPILKIRDAISNQRFGKILHGMIQIRWNRNQEYYSEARWRGTWKEDGGTLMNQCIHGIDLLQWILGEDAVRVQAQTRRFLRHIEAEDFGAAIVEFKNGAVGIIEGSAIIFPKNLNETLSIFGDKGSAVISGLAVNKIETWRFADADFIGDTEEQVLCSIEKDPPNVYGFGHTALFKDFVESINNNRDPVITGENGKKALDIVLGIYKSQKTGKAVELPCDFSTEEMEGFF